MRFATLLMLVAVGFSATNAYAQDFHLVEPSGTITADVFLRPGQMVVNDVSGNQYVFMRDRSFDSINGQYVGYWLPGLNRIVRFPASGNGLMQVADLDDVYPRYVYSRRSVRRVGGRPGHHHGFGSVYIPPHFVSPYGYPALGYGYQSYGTALHVGPIGIPGLSLRRRPAYLPMQSIVLDSRIVPRDPLPPVTIKLLNTASREIRVTVIDRVQADQAKRIRIAPGTTAPLLVQRDAGADRVRRVLTFAPDGSQITREFSTPIEPAPRYELIVHEWRLQSVAIDRTGKSPNVIEDTQFQGRGLGRFELPPGDQLTGGSMDVVRVALQAGNQGAVAPLLDDQQNADPLRPVSPLEKMLLEQQKARGR